MSRHVAHVVQVACHRGAGAAAHLRRDASTIWSIWAWPGRAPHVDWTIRDVQLDDAVAGRADATGAARGCEPRRLRRK
jgi:hypothetical protein